ncbi:DUF1990 domain-containing protein [Nocardioides yefusunii]|uniref:DUF1990 domain-containing protein n=1 Tax=Nocardioides yefusunii TaxID=2500546 RepID=A0ABW1QSI4_9ACTN|nr:DUF1990 domain-containing protein [Nocardioides yefusunii]
MVTLIDAAVAEELRTVSPSHDHPDAVLAEHPRGFRTVHETRFLPGADLGHVGDRLLTWGVHEGAGLDVFVTSPRVAVGEVILMRWRPFAWVPRWTSITVPCRVTHVWNDPDRVGFVYTTLPGHPEHGEELFLLEPVDGGVQFTVTAFSKAGRWFTWLGAPVARRVQDATTRKYLHAL